MRFLRNTLAAVTGLAVLAIAPLGIWWGFATEHFARYWMALVLPGLSLGLAALWYLVFGPGRFQTRVRVFGGLALFLLFCGLAFQVIFRYEGSTSGASLPRFVPRWTPPPSAAALALPAEELTAAPRPVDAAPVEGLVDSPQFYGPGRDAIWPEESLAASFDWAEHPPEELWRRPVGQGWSGFAVAGRRALTQEQRGDEELVTCYDLLTGELLWVHRDRARYYDSAETGSKEMAGDGPRAVPTVQGDRVYAYGATGILNCLSLETGGAIWQRDILEDLGVGVPEWGKSCSPLVLEDLGLVVVTGAGGEGVTLLACSVEDGDTAWEARGGGTSYSSPRLLELHGVRQIVSVNAEDVTGHDPATGKELWRFGWTGRMPKVAQPIDLPGDRLLVTASYGAGSHLIQIGHAEGAWTARSLWFSQRLKTKFSSAVVLGGHAWGLDEGRLACIDLADGSRAWKEGRYGFGQTLLAGDKILVQAEAGYLSVVEASAEEFREIARLEALDSMTWNPPALAGRYLLVRNDREAICFKLPPAAEEAASP